MILVFGPLDFRTRSSVGVRTKKSGKLLGRIVFGGVVASFNNVMKFFETIVGFLASDRYAQGRAWLGYCWAFFATFFGDVGQLGIWTFDDCLGTYGFLVAWTTIATVDGKEFIVPLENSIFKFFWKRKKRDESHPVFRILFVFATQTGDIRSGFLKLKRVYIKAVRFCNAKNQPTFTQKSPHVNSLENFQSKSLRISSAKLMRQC